MENISDMKMRAVKLLIEQGSIKTFSQIFTMKHLTVLALSQILHKNYIPTRARIDDPSLLTLGDIIDIADALKVDHQKMLNIIWVEAKQKKKPR